MIVNPLAYLIAETKGNKKEDQAGQGKQNERNPPSPTATETVALEADDWIQHCVNTGGYGSQDHSDLGIGGIKSLELQLHDGACDGFH